MWWGVRRALTLPRCGWLLLELLGSWHANLPHQVRQPHDGRSDTEQNHTLLLGVMRKKLVVDVNLYLASASSLSG